MFTFRILFHKKSCCLMHMLCFLNKMQGMYWLPRGRRWPGRKNRSSWLNEWHAAMKLQEAAEEKRGNRRMRTAEHILCVDLLEVPQFSGIMDKKNSCIPARLLWLWLQSSSTPSPRPLQVASYKRLNGRKGRQHLEAWAKSRSKPPLINSGMEQKMAVKWRKERCEERMKASRR